jgi:hypothetical protein
MTVQAYLAAGAAGLLLAGAQAAQAEAPAQPWVIEANAVKVNDLTGGELGIGYRFAAGNFRVTPIVGALIYKGGNDRYDKQTISNGTTICRDLSNGQFANKESCNDSAAKAYGKLEATYRFGHSVELGGGVRVSNRTTPYGTLAAFVSDAVAVKAVAGKDYYGAGLALVF